MLFEKSENKKLKKLRSWIGKIFSKLGISPDTWTLLSMFFAVLAFFSILNRDFLFGAMFIIFSGIIDLIDGAVARETKRVTKFGAYLDTIADRYSEFLYILPLAFLNLPPVVFQFDAWVLLLLFGSMMTTYAKAAAAEKEVKKELKGGIIERAERVGLYVVALILAPFNLSAFQYIIIALALLSNLSAIQRIAKAIAA